MNAAKAKVLSYPKNGSYVSTKTSGTTRGQEYLDEDVSMGEALTWVREKLDQIDSKLDRRLPEADPELVPLNFEQSQRTQSQAERTDASKMKFEGLIKIWKSETEVMSLIHDKVMHSAYQQIIGMGADAIPLILAQLDIEPDHWFWALKSITCENPVTEDIRGDIDKMAEAWLNWGWSHGYKCTKSYREDVPKPELIGV